MSLTQRIKYLYLAYFSKPTGDRALYRWIKQRRISRIVELGVGNGQRGLRLIGLAQSLAAADAVRYVGVDMFEGRPRDAAPGLTLKEAHKLMQATGAKVQFLPGDPFSALARGANANTGTELFLVAADQDPQSLARAWFYVPRMLADGAVVLLEQPADKPGESTWRRLRAEELERLAAPPARQRAA